MENNTNNEQFNQKIIDFWEKDIWKSNIENIHNKRIYNVLYEIYKLQNSIKSHGKFLVTNSGDFKICHHSNIHNAINKIKNDNINYIKTHADSIPEYHLLIINLKNNYLH